MSADIHALELEFARNPTLEACLPLCEAYLAAQRYMEAMVVCKKGIKSAPDDPRGRTMLGRVYVDQGKFPKAETELGKVLETTPGFPDALVLMARVQKEQGHADQAVASLQQALQTDPTSAEAHALLAELGVAPAAAPVQAQAPQAAVPAGYPPQQMPGQPGFPGQQAQMPPQGMPQNPQAPGYPQQPGAVPAGYPQQGQAPQVAAPAASPFQTGPNPALDPVAGQPQSPSLDAVAQQAQQAAGDPNQPPADPWSVAPGEPVTQPEKKLEHVDDFFSEDSLGFQNEDSTIETAGPGRLTIVGFVPKSVGSVKTTIFTAIGFLAILVAFVAWRYVAAQNTQEINRLFGQIKLAMDTDRYPRYKDALGLGDQILEIDGKHALTLSTLSYAAAILGHEHQEDGAIDKARSFLERAQEAESKKYSWGVASQALLALHDNKLDAGIQEAQKLIAEGLSHPLFELEVFRLRNQAAPEDKKTQQQLARLKQSVTSDARVFNYLGWYHYAREEFDLADKYFNQAEQNSKAHPASLVGKVLTEIARGTALKERQGELEKSIKKVFSQEADLSKTVLAKAYFARAELETFQGKKADAAKDYSKAFELDGENPAFYFRRGTSALGQGSTKQAVADLKKAASLDANNPRYYKRLAEAQIRARDTEGAAASLSRAAQLSPNDTEVVLLSGKELRAEKKYAEAIEKYRTVEKENEDAYARAQVGIAVAHRESGSPQKALRHLSRFLEKLPDSVTATRQAELFCELGMAYDDTKNRNKAMESFRVGIEQDATYPTCHYYMCKSIGRGGQAKEACRTYLTLAPRGEFAADARRRSR